MLLFLKRERMQMLSSWKTPWLVSAYSARANIRMHLLLRITPLASFESGSGEPGSHISLLMMKYTSLLD